MDESRPVKALVTCVAVAWSCVSYGVTDWVSEVTYFLPSAFGWSQQMVYVSMIDSQNQFWADRRNVESMIRTFDGVEYKSIPGFFFSGTNESNIALVGRYNGPYGSSILSNSTVYFDLMGFNVSYTGHEEVLSYWDADERMPAFYQYRSDGTTELLDKDFKRLDGSEPDWSLFQYASGFVVPVGRQLWELKVGGLEHLWGKVVVSNSSPHPERLFYSASAAIVVSNWNDRWHFWETNRNVISESIINDSWGLLSDPWELDIATEHLRENIVMAVTNSTKLRLVFWPGSMTLEDFGKQRTNR